MSGQVLVLAAATPGAAPRRRPIAPSPPTGASMASSSPTSGREGDSRSGRLPAELGLPAVTLGRYDGRSASPAS